MPTTRRIKLGYSQFGATARHEYSRHMPWPPRTRTLCLTVTDRQKEEEGNEAIEKLEEKIKNRERKKRKRMDISGKDVFKIQELKDKKEENFSKD